MFVVNSAADGDGEFTNGDFAYAYLGGPFLVMTYDNDNWGINDMEIVTAHETGHIFYALDEYNHPQANSYTDHSGYYNTQNLNAFNGNPNPSTRVNSIMADDYLQRPAYANHTSSPTSLKMLGWQDSDSDQLLDVLDVPLALTGSGSYNSATRMYAFTGTSSVQTLTNLNPRGGGRNITLNEVNRLQYRVDGGNWADAATYGTFSASINVTVGPLPTGAQAIELRTIANDSGATSSVYIDSFGSNHPPVLSSPQVTPLYGTTADTYQFTVHYYDQDGDDPRPYSPRVYIDLNYGNLTLQSGSPSDGTYYYATTLPPSPPGGYTSYFVLSDGQSTRLSDLIRGPYVGVPQGNDLSTSNSYQVWDDGPYHAAMDNLHSDDDGIPEAGEAVNVEIGLLNSGGVDVTNVRAQLTTTIGNVQITSPDVFYDAVPHQGCSYGGGKYKMFLNFGSTWNNLPFSLNVTYAKNGVDYVQNIPFSHTFYAEGQVGPDLSVDHIVAYDSLGGNGNGIPESGEDINFDIYLKNTGNAGAIDIQAHIADLKGPGFTANTDEAWRDYPDIVAGGPAQKQFSFYYTNLIPRNFAGPLTADIIVQAAGGHQWTYNDYPLFTVQAAPWILVDPRQWDFGISPTNVNVTKDVAIRNVGSGDLHVTGITTSPDTTYTSTPPPPVPPWTIPAGGSRTLSVTIQTAALQGQITRQVIVASDGRPDGTNPPADRITITGLVSDTPPAFQIPGALSADTNMGADASGDLVVWNDNRNGNPDIYAYDLTTGNTTAVCTNSAGQYNPRVSGSIIAWRDRRNWNGVGTPTCDIYGYNWTTHQEFAVSTDPADERLVGVDGNFIAFQRVFHVWTEAHGYGPNPSNLFVYDVSNGTTTALTNYAYSDHSPLDTVVWGDDKADFGAGLVTWRETHLVWQSTPFPSWVTAGGSLKKQQLGVDLAPIQILGTDIACGPTTNDGKIAWVVSNLNRNARKPARNRQFRCVSAQGIHSQQCASPDSVASSHAFPGKTMHLNCI